MTDPIETLRALPPESPPREAVLASLRLFRYRTVATILLAAIAVLGLAIVGRATGGEHRDGEVRDILEHHLVEYQAVTGTQQIGPVRITVTEVATSPAGNAARVLFEHTGSAEREIDFDLLAVRQGTATLAPIVSVPTLGTDAGRRSTAEWVPLDPIKDPIGAALEWLVLPIPDSILDEGGELTVDDGFTGVVTIERTTTN